MVGGFTLHRVCNGQLLRGPDFWKGGADLIRSPLHSQFRRSSRASNRSDELESRILIQDIQNKLITSCMKRTASIWISVKPLVSYYILLTCFLAEYFILFLNKKKIKIFLFSASKVGKGSHPKLALATLTAFLTKYRSVSHFGWSCAPRLEPLGFVFFGHVGKG